MKAPREKLLPFERVLTAFRSGKATKARRRAWHQGSRLVLVDTSLFVMNPSFFGPAPKKWEPYPQDFLAKDWVLLS